MKWKHPSITKIYEALGAVADGRVEVSSNTAKVYSSSRNKYYDIVYDPDKNQIMSNDNSSFYKGELGYPSIAFLMSIKALSCDDNAANILKGIAWKDINQKFKNDFDKALAFILSTKTKEETDLLKDFTEKINKELIKLNLGLLGKRTTPPKGY